MDNLSDIVKQEVCWYASGGVNSKAYPIFDDERHTYTVTAVGHPKGKRLVGIVVLARIEGDTVIIEEDRTDKPLYQHLIQAGIPREKIILAYEGEPIPEK